MPPILSFNIDLTSGVNAPLKYDNFTVDVSNMLVQIMPHPNEILNAVLINIW
jgi:hypothetical protein